MGDGMEACLRSAGSANEAWAWGSGLRVGPASREPHTRPAQLLADPATAATVVTEHAEARGLATNRFAASLVFQRYCNRWCGLAVWTWTMTGQVLDLRAERCATTFGGGSPTGMWLDSVRTAGEDGERLLCVLVDEHLVPIASAFKQCAGLGLPNAWGNIAAALAGGFRVASRFQPPDAVRARAEALANCRPRLAAAGTYRVVSNGSKARLFYDRKTCCHWDEVPDGRLCTWCSKRTKDERTDEFLRLLAADS